MEIDFIKVIKKNKKNKTLLINDTHKAYNFEQTIIEDIEFNYSKFFMNIDYYRTELEKSNFLKKLKEQLNNGLFRDRLPTEEIISYGLGDVCNSKISQFQFSLLLCIASYLQIPHDKVFLYDPIFTTTQYNIFNKFSFQIIPYNEEGNHICEKRTLILAFHCGRPLYNNLLTTNWQHHLLHNVALLANSFNNIIHSISVKMSHDVIPAILQLRDAITEMEVKNTFKYSDIFNDTSLLTFINCDFLQRIYSQSPPPRPDYLNNEEIIFNKE